MKVIVEKTNKKVHKENNNVAKINFDLDILNVFAKFIIKFIVNFYKI